MAALAIPAAIEAGMTYGPMAIQGAQLGHHLYKKYKPGVKRVANHVFSRDKRKSALNYTKGLGTKKGLHKFITKDLGKAAGATSEYIKSGKALKHATGVTHDLGRIVDVANPLLKDEDYDYLKKGLKTADKHISHYHQLAEKYNEKGDKIQEMYKSGGPSLKDIQQIHQAVDDHKMGRPTGMGVFRQVDPESGLPLPPGILPRRGGGVGGVSLRKRGGMKSAQPPRRLDVRPI